MKIGKHCCSLMVLWIWSDPRKVLWIGCWKRREPPVLSTSPIVLSRESWPTRFVAPFAYTSSFYSSFSLIRLCYCYNICLFRCAVKFPMRFTGISRDLAATTSGGRYCTFQINLKWSEIWNEMKMWNGIFSVWSFVSLFWLTIFVLEWHKIEWNLKWSGMEFTGYGASEACPGLL